MSSIATDPSRLIPRSRLVPSGEAAIASAGLTLAALLLCTTAVSAWWAHHEHLAHAGDYELLTGAGGVAAGALLVLWIVYRRIRSRLLALGAVHDALRAAAEGETDLAALCLNAELGPEAMAWNRIIGEADRLRRLAMGERARQSLDNRRESRSDLNAACDVMPQGLILIDQKCRVIYSNGAAAAFLRCKPEELLNADLSARIAADSVKQALAEVNAGISRRRHVLDIEHKDDQDTGTLRFIIRPVRRDDNGSAMVIIEDITQQRAAEEARHRFVAQATHELRTPLTHIRLYAETAIEEGESGDPAARFKCLNVINSEARRLARIIDEMLSVAEIEAGSLKLKFDDVQLEALLDDLKDDYGQQAEERKLTLTFLLPPKFPVFMGDHDKILLALHNLIGNAMKYTPEGGRVEVRVESGEKSLSFQVRDTGIGISDTDAERIFERFYRAKDPRVAKITGSGLGLTLAREVIRLHGGDITVESRLNEGTTFTMTLPLKAAV